MRNQNFLSGLALATAMLFGVAPGLAEARQTSIDSQLLEAFEKLRAVSHEVGRNRQILKTNPRDADAHYNLGVLYAGQKLYREAAASYRRALTINPEDTSARKNLTNLIAKHHEQLEDKTTTNSPKERP